MRKGGVLSWSATPPPPLQLRHGLLKRNFCIRKTTNSTSMETQQVDNHKENKTGEATPTPRLTPPPPTPPDLQPPEKPLPGDCCGSGCVRCVWDVYYEELEEYNNNLSSRPPPPPPSSTK